MARKPGLARQPVASHCGSGACTVTPAPADDETWPERRCSDGWQRWGTRPGLPVGGRMTLDSFGPWPPAPMQLPGPRPTGLVTSLSSLPGPIPSVPTQSSLWRPISPALRLSLSESVCSRKSLPWSRLGVGRGQVAGSSFTSQTPRPPLL